jgi:hypothetical protein
MTLELRILQDRCNVFRDDGLLAFSMNDALLTAVEPSPIGLRGHDQSKISYLV